MSSIRTVLLLAALVAWVGSAQFAQVPNADRLWIDGHLWHDVLSATSRPQVNGAKNAFGTAYTNTPSWATLCPLDSDGDGFTNGEELGDPTCVWTVGATPTRTTGLSHPGLYSSVPVDAYPSRTRTVATCTRDSDSLGDNRVALRSVLTVAAPTSMKRLDRTERVAMYRKPTPDNLTETRASCPHLQSGLLDWHSASTWGGNGIPLGLSSVTLPANTKVLVSSCSLDPRGYLSITIPEGSQLIFADAPIFLRVKDLIVQGDLLLGSASCPLHSTISISFTAEKTESSYTNGITAHNRGSIRLHGTRNPFTWTRLAATILPGTAHVLVQDAVGWGPGDEIVVATSIYKDLAVDQNERRVVVAVSNDGKTLVVNKPFSFKHWASIEYQSEVGLLTRSIVLRGGLTDTAHAARYGGHTMAMGPLAVTEVIGVRAHRMGQQNVLGRYPFHMHLVINGNRSTLQQASCDQTYYRCVSVHKTNHTLIRKNVAYNVSANCYYLEDGSEMFNRIEYNLAVYVLPLGTPAAGGAQTGQVFDEDSSAIQPADHAAAGFYISNPHNWVVGNAASGGWSGFAYPIFPYAQRLSSDLKMNPSSYPVLEFDGNTAHSSGTFWGDAGCIYFGGLLTEVSGKFRYSNGRYVHPTMGMNNVSNLRTWLCNRGLSSWGERVELWNYEAHDVKRSAVLFGESSIHNMIVTGNTANNALDMLGEGRQGFGFYDTWVQTSLANVTFANFWDRGLAQWNRDAVIVDLDHSDIFKPWYISATRNLRMENVDNSMRIGRWVRETGASRMFNIVDWDGSLVGLEQCNATIIGSEIDWWNVGPDCWYNDNWPAWLCPRKPGREVVGIDMDLPGIQQELDIQTDSTNMLTQAQRDQLYIGHISQFGSKSGRKLIVTRNHHTATGLSGIGWYLYLTTGVPERIKVWPQNFATTGTFIFFAISYPAGTSFDIWAVPRWNAYSTRFNRVDSRQAVLDGNGTMYHFDGRHLYLKISDMWSPYPNAYTRQRIAIPDTMATSVDIVITASCPSKNSQGFCTTPSSADPPSDIDIPIHVCNDKSEQITPLKPRDLCPNLTDVMPPNTSDPNVVNFKDCAEYTDKWNVWRCAQNYVKNGKYCQASCNNSCRVYNPFPYRCSFMEPCIASEFQAPPAETCAAMNTQPLTDECTMKTCDSTYGNLGFFPLAVGTPCNQNAGINNGFSTCNGNKGCVVRQTFNPSLPIVSRLTDRPSVRATASNVVEVSVSLPALVTSVQVILQSLPSMSYQSFSMTRQASQSSDAAAIYTYTAASAVRRNVTVVLGTTLPGANSTLTYRFLDWNAKSNVVPSFDAPAFDSSTFGINIDPIDWVTSAEFRSGYGSSAVATPLACDYGVASRCSATVTGQPGSDAHVVLTLATGVLVKRSLPCLISSLVGSSCNTSIHTVRSTSKCRAGLVINGISAWYAAIGLSSTTPSTLIKNMTVGPTNKVLSLVNWGAVWAGNTWAEDVGANLTLTLSTGEREIFWLPKWSEGKAGDALVCLSGVKVDAADERGRAGTCSAVGRCDAVITPISNNNMPQPTSPQLPSFQPATRSVPSSALAPKISVVFAAIVALFVLLF